MKDCNKSTEVGRKVHSAVSSRIFFVQAPDRLAPKAGCKQIEAPSVPICNKW